MEYGQEDANEGLKKPPTHLGRRTGVGDIQKILVANRGEIACRILKSCHLLEISTVAVYSEVDENTLQSGLPMRRRSSAQRLRRKVIFI